MGFPYACQAPLSSKCAGESMAALHWALKQRQAMNTLLTVALWQLLKPLRSSPFAGTTYTGRTECP